MEDRKVRFSDPFVDSLSEAHWNVISTPAFPYKKSIKHRDIVATTMDRWIELLVKENLIKQYQAETLRIIASDPGIPIGYYHRPQKFSLLPQSRCEGKTTTALCDELHVPMESKLPEFDSYISGNRLFLSPVLEFGTQNQNGRIYSYKQFSCRNVLSMEERRKIGL